MSRRLRIMPLYVVVLWMAAQPVAGQQRHAGSDQNLENTLDTLDLESLLNLKVTTASKFKQDLSDAPGVLAVVSKDELTRFGGSTLREILERVPGLAGTSAHFTDRSLVASRGDQTKINGGHILYLINGRPTREVLEGGVVTDLLESFPVNALERIEVIKGPGSVLYGSNAFSAVVNLITSDSRGNKIRATAAAGPENASAMSADATLQRGDLRILVAGQSHKRSDWRTTYRFPFVDPLFPEASSVSSQDVSLRDRSAGMYLQADYKSLTFMSSFTEWHGPSFVRGTVGENRWRRGFADLGYGFKASDTWNMNFNATYTRTTLSVPSFPFIGRDSNEVVLEWTNTMSPTFRDSLTFGALYSYVSGQENYYGVTPGITISEGRRPGAAAYAQLDHELRDNLKLIGGIQANKVRGSALSLVPRGGAIWNATKRVSVKALYSKAFRAPSINETGLNHPGLEGTSGLKPEKVGTFDLQVSYQGKRFQTGINYFFSKQTDSIVIDTSTARWKYRNLGEATFQGVELQEKYYFKKDLFVSGSVLYQTNWDETGAHNVTPIANFGARAGVSYQSDNGFTASLFDTYQGHLDEVGSTVNPPAGSYHLLSSYLRYDISRYVGGKGLALFLRGDNLTNRQIWMPDWGGNSGDTIPVNRGRALLFGFEISVARE